MVIKKMTPSGYVLGAITAILVHRRGLAVRELHARRAGRQPRALHRRGRRLRHRDAVQRLGHHLAQQQEDHPRNAGRHSPRQRRVLARQAFLASRTNFFLSVPLLFFMATSYHYVIFGK